MANIKSAKKRILVNETKAARNKSIKSRVKTAMKKVEAAVAAKDVALANETLKAAIAEINKAGIKGRLCDKWSLFPDTGKFLCLRRQSR